MTLARWRGLAALAAVLTLLWVPGCGPGREDKEAAVEVVKSAVEDCLQRMSKDRAEGRATLLKCQCAGQEFTLAYHPQDKRLYLLKQGKPVEALALKVRGIRVLLTDQGGSFMVTAGGG